MLQISVDLNGPSSLSREQRVALAEFILAFPNHELTVKPEIDPDDSAGDEITPEQAFARPIEITTGAITITQMEPGPLPMNRKEIETLAANGPTRDKSGLPWDERIHAGSKALVADGLWRMKRGVDAGLVAQVEGELRVLMAIPVPHQPFSIPPPPADMETTPFVPAAPAAAIPSITASPAVSAQPVDANPMREFHNLLTFASGAIQKKQLTLDQVNATVTSIGVPSLPLLQNRLDLVPQVYSVLSQMVAAQ